MEFEIEIRVFAPLTVHARKSHIYKYIYFCHNIIVKLCICFKNILIAYYIFLGFSYVACMCKYIYELYICARVCTDKNTFWGAPSQQHWPFLS